MTGITTAFKAQLETVYRAIETEIAYQDNKWGEGKPQSLPGYLLIMRKELEEAEAAWMKNNTESRQSPLEEILQVVTVGIRCLEHYGVVGSARATNDIAEEAIRAARLRAADHE